MEYIIQPGDNLSKIARRYGMTWPELWNYDGGTGKPNKDRLDEQKKAKGRPERSIGNPNLIYPNDVILVPDQGTSEGPGPTPAPAPPPSLAAFMIPSYLISIGSEKFSPESFDVISVKVTRSMGLPTDCCEVLLFRSYRSDSFKQRDAVKIQLGYDQKLEPVFSGLADVIERDEFSVRVTALGLAVNLLRLRLHCVYMNQTAGKIVNNLAQEANIKVKKTEDGVNLPMYVVDEATNAYEHILKLAERCGFEVYMTDDEALVFKEWNGGQEHSIEYAKELIGAESIGYVPIYVRAIVYGESPSIIRGFDTFHWLTKQEVKGEAGTGKEVIQIHEPAIKDKKTAETSAKAILDIQEMFTNEVVVETVGKPEIKLGDTITIGNAPTTDLEGIFEVLGIEHFFSIGKGFTTRFDCCLRGW